MLFTINKSLNGVGSIFKCLFLTLAKIFFASLLKSNKFNLSKVQYDPGSERMLLFVYFFFCILISGSKLQS